MSILNNLFKTKALKVAEEKPFWYHSGKIGPHFVNVENLYGSAEEAKQMLSFIDKGLAEHSPTLIQDLAEMYMQQYESNEIYREVIDSLVNNIEIYDQDFMHTDVISGGMRRDLMFSIPVAIISGKPHITIFKKENELSDDPIKYGDIVLTYFSGLHNPESTSINIKGNALAHGTNVAHVCDLVNTASSQLESWKPAIESVGGQMVANLTVFDRNEGGAKKLCDNGINSGSLANLTEDLFNKAYNSGLITKKQAVMCMQYTAEPTMFANEYITENPDFVRDALISEDKKTNLRAHTCIAKGWYEATSPIAEEFGIIQGSVQGGQTE